MARPRGLFITLEGPDGSGKSTQAKLLAAEFRRRGLKVLLTREPGGSVQAAKIRNLVLKAKGFLSPASELLLFLADRAQHAKDTLEPALTQGKVVICDRFGDSTLAYQGAGRGFSMDTVRKLHHFAAGGLVPDVTLLFDLGTKQALMRAKQRGQLDRMEGAGAEFHKRVRAGFLRLARQEPRRIKLIKAAGKTPVQVRDEAWGYLERFL